MTRLHDWQERLDAYLSSNRESRFMYGRWDCGLFVSGAIQAMTGMDPAESWREIYHTRKGAMDLALKRHGKASLLAIATDTARKLELESCAPLFARRGDMVLIKRSRDYALGLVDLSGEYILTLSRCGFERWPLTLSAFAWHI